MRTLIIEDDFELASLIRESIEKHFINSRCVVAPDGSIAFEFLERIDPNLVIIDLKLPGEINGVEICRKIRDSSCDPMIMMITGDADSENRVNSYASGADDYIHKPFKFDELKVRIEALFRRAKRKGAQNYFNCIKTRHLMLDRNRMKVFVFADSDEEKQIELRPKEYELLLVLMMNKNRVWTRDALVQKIWADEEAKTRILDSHMSRLRKKLDAELNRKPDNSLIQTIRGVGYMFSD